jgi:hypothetical protein
VEPFLKAIQGFKTSELEVLLDWYGLCGDELFKDQIKVIRGELELRKTSLGKELS